MPASRRTSPLVGAARRAGVTDERVLAALAAVARDRFVRPGDRRAAGDDRPLPTSGGQTTSQPSLIASMLQRLELRGHERVLEVGTGTGYQAALLAQLAREVWTIEVVPALAERARAELAAIGADVEVVLADGRLGFPDRAPFDAVIVAAASTEVPTALGDQLAEGGRLVAPVGSPDLQQLVVLQRRGGRLVELERHTPVRFVPLVEG